MNPFLRPSERLQLLRLAICSFLATAVLSLLSAVEMRSGGPSGAALVWSVLAAVALIVGTVALAGHVLVRILEELRTWSPAPQATGVDWYRDETEEE